MFNQMKQLSSDPRYETRNCAVQTLLKILQSHGELLNQDIWIICIEKVIFPGVGKNLYVRLCLDWHLK
jgi:hypothetical protein